MNKKLYYTIEPELIVFKGVNVHYGLRSIYIYSIEGDIPKIMGRIDGVEEGTTNTDAIQEYLNDNGYSNETFEMRKL